MIIITPKYNLLMPLYSCKIVDFAQSNTRSLTKSGDVTIFCFYCWCFNTTFSNISDISWRPVLLVEETGVHGEKSPTMGRRLDNFITCGCESSTTSYFRLYRFIRTLYINNIRTLSQNIKFMLLCLSCNGKSVKQARLYCFSFLPLLNMHQVPEKLYLDQ